MRLAGIQYGDKVQGLGTRPAMAVGEAMIGRVLNAIGAPLDGRPHPKTKQLWPLDGATPTPMERHSIKVPLQTGLRVLDGLLTVGRGQRIGIFGGSGVGKSTLIGMMTRNTAADLTVVGLVGERGREVREFVEESLGSSGMERAVVLVSTSDQTPLLRMRAAMAATAVAEFYAAQGKHVLLVLDSLTRFAMAAAGGRPSRRRTAGEQRIYAKRIYQGSQVGGASRKLRARKHYRVLYSVEWRATINRIQSWDAVRSYVDGHVCLIANDGFRRAVPACRCAGLTQPSDACSIPVRRTGPRPRSLAGCWRLTPRAKT